MNLSRLHKLCPSEKMIKFVNANLHFSSLRGDHRPRTIITSAFNMEWQIVLNPVDIMEVTKLHSFVTNMSRNCRKLSIHTIVLVCKKSTKYLIKASFINKACSKLNKCSLYQIIYKVVPYMKHYFCMVWDGVYIWRRYDVEGDIFQMYEVGFFFCSIICIDVWTRVLLGDFM